jgi:hypothetical protein
MSLSRRRARALSAADRALWQAYVARVDPLPGRALPPAELAEAPPAVIAQEAHDAVRGFLVDAFNNGLRCVAVITGRGSSPEGGVLRRELPHWLNAPDMRRLLLAAAHPHAANTGAVHLMLRRRK